MKATVGRIVHYVSYGTPGGEYPSVCRAAVVSAEGADNRASLVVLNPTGMFFNEGVPYAPEDEGALVGGTWHWPERVDA